MANNARYNLPRVLLQHADAPHLTSDSPNMWHPMQIIMV